MSAVADWRRSAPRIAVNGVTWIVRTITDRIGSYSALYRYDGRTYTPAGRGMLAGLRDEYPPGSRLWTWLEEHGIKRPPASRSSGPTIPHAQRKRPLVQLTLSPAAIARLDELAVRYGSRSAAVEVLVLGDVKGGTTS